MLKMLSFLASSAAVALLAAAGPAAAQSVPPASAAEVRDWRLGEVPMPKDNVSTPARVELGRTLFFDPRLSGAGAMSCASCHEPSLGWTDGRKTSVVGSDVMGRASPTIVNLGYNTLFTWDGRKKTLEEHAVGPHKHLSTPDFKAAAERIGKIGGYQKMFASAYPGEPIEVETIAKAMAAFQRTVVSGDSPFDRWLAGDTKALTPQQYRGYTLFVDPGKGNCAACHRGANFTDNGFHNIGLKTADPGRFAFLKLASMKGAFKTPTLREIEMTAPYFHDGSATTLREVVDFYARGGDDRSNVSGDVKKLDLTEQDKDDLVAFLRSLTGRFVAVVRPVLPQ
ncbi:cytochrome-c peroxidase [Caenimonas terrae]|uniref:Cytochrome-c peroxidase n=1 Tax=Caenimonas terrae TaxID=696074 RepID=A0ABW0NHE2_9BURK